MSVAHNEPFDPFYDVYSIRSREFVLSDWIDLYLPTNQIDAACLSVLVPSQHRGAKRWTLNGKWITIGVFRDEGRANAKRPPVTGLSWTRTASLLTLVSPNHYLMRGDRINLFNLNVPYSFNDYPVVSVTDSTITVQVPALGGSTGVNGAWQETVDTNFYENHIVFRLLPSFQLVPYNTIVQLFAQASPQQSQSTREIFNYTTNSSVKIPSGKGRSTNYDTPGRSLPRAERLSLDRRFDQAYLENGSPISITYEPNGSALPVARVDGPNRNERVFYNQPVQQELLLNNYVHVYDFYGLDINDPVRGPYFASDLVKRNVLIPAPRDNIERRVGGSGVPLYSGKLFDKFGNRCIGIQENESLFVREQVLPIAIDKFNRPIGNPVGSRESTRIASI